MRRLAPVVVLVVALAIGVTDSGHTQTGLHKPGFDVDSNRVGPLSTTTFITPHGRLVVYLPSDMKAGDTISGTVVAEPSGATEDERAQNLAGLNGYRLKFGNETIKSPWGSFSWTWLKNTPAPVPSPSPSATPNNETKLPLGMPPRPSDETGMVQMQIDLITPIALERGVRHVIEDTETRDDPSGNSRSNKMDLPSTGQNGRPAIIKGPFDGKAETTEVKVGGNSVTILAESPRSCVFQSPEQNVGPSEIALREGATETRGPYRNIGVRLSAPKTNLMKGEQTTVTITVSGLQGLRQNLPLLLEKKGDVSIDGGDVQTIQVRPNDVIIEGVEARFDVRKVIVGLRPGAFNITATVIDPRVRPVIIPLVENGRVNGYRVQKDGTGFIVNVEKVKYPITGEPVDGRHKLEHRCPNLGSLPIVKQIFLNQGIGKTKTDCLVIVTPRIIIQEEN